MKLDRLADLYADPGPFASAHVEVGREQEDGDRLAALQARAARDELVARGAPEELAQQVADRLASSTHEGGPVSRCVVPGERGVLLDELTHRQHASRAPPTTCCPTSPDGWPRSPCWSRTSSCWSTTRAAG